MFDGQIFIIQRLIAFIHTKRSSIQEGNGKQNRRQIAFIIKT